MFPVSHSNWLKKYVFFVLALELNNLSENGFNDPYVKVSLIPEVDTKIRRTDIRRNCPDPYFNEIFKFPVTYDELAEKHLLFQVFDYDRFSRNDVTGEVRVDMREVDITSEIEVWSEIYKGARVCMRNWMIYAINGKRLLRTNLPAIPSSPTRRALRANPCTKITDRSCQL